MKTQRLILLLIAVLALVATYDVVTNGPAVFTDYFEQFSDTAQAQEPMRQSMTVHSSRIDTFTEKHEASSLIVDNNFGSVTVLPSSDEQVHIDGKLTVFATEQKYADEYLAECSVKLEKTGDNLRVYVDRGAADQIDGRFINGLQVDYNIEVPSEWALNIANRHGKVEVTDFISGVTIDNQHGPSVVKNIQGMVKLESRHGSARIESVQGEVTLSNEFGPSDVFDISGTVNAMQRHDKLNLTRIGGSVDVRVEHDNADLRDVKGNIYVESQHGDVYVINPEKELRFRGSHSDLTVRELKNTADLETAHGDIEVTLSNLEEGYRVDGRSKYNSVRTDFPLSITEVDSNTKVARGTIGEGKHDLRIDVEFGNVDIRR